MEKGDSLSKVLVNYGPREEQMINEIKEISKKASTDKSGIRDSKASIPDNKNEVFRRGLHAVRYLAEVDEELLLSLLSQVLHLCAIRYDLRNLKIAKEIAFAAFAVQIAKYGVLRSEIFDSIPRELQLIEGLIESKKPKQSEIEDELKKTMKRLANSVDTIFRTQKKEHTDLLFPVLFLGEALNKKMIKDVPDYGNISSDAKMHFLVDAMRFAHLKGDSEVKKKDKELEI